MEDNFNLKHENSTEYDSKQTSPETALWRAVITQALMDAGSSSKKQEMNYSRYHAKSWLQGDSKDFELVCDLAGLNPYYVSKNSKKAIAKKCTWRKTKKEKARNYINIITPDSIDGIITIPMQAGFPSGASDGI
ncbi:MAG: hypothetical protein ACK5BE_00765 [Alphaproteobacteria bacterium]|jgi:hypothetical protein